jgi:hypothetical protein
VARDNFLPIEKSSVEYLKVPILEVPIIHQVLKPVNLLLDHPAVQKLAVAYRDALGLNLRSAACRGPAMPIS